MPDTAEREHQYAEVIAAGTHEDVKLNVGELVVYRQYSGTEIKVEEDDHLVVEADDILGVVEY